MTTPDGNIAIQFLDVTYRTADGRPLISNFNLAVFTGETLVLLGRSGSGKTTTLKLINRLLVCHEGQVIVEGKSTADWAPIRLRRHIGYAIQEVGLFPHINVERNIALVPQLEGWEPKKIQSRVEELLTLVGLSPAEFRRRYPHQLSGGQRQRVGLGRALAADPPILLMDEPFGALDPITRSEMQKEFRDLQQRLKKTVIFVTHDLREALLLADRVALMEDGRLIANLPVAEFPQSRDPLVRAYMDAFSACEPR